MFIRPLVAVSALLIVLNSAQALAEAFPSLQAEDLNGIKLSLPDGLPSDRTLVLIGFRHKDQEAIDEWISRLELNSRAVPWYEVTAIGPVPPFVSGLIRTGMRRRLQSPAERAHMIPFFRDRTALLKLQARPQEIRLLVVNRAGQVLASASGPFDVAKATSLMGALGHNAVNSEGPGQ